jgi:hypothetical protein
MIILCLKQPSNHVLFRNFGFGRGTTCCYLVDGFNSPHPPYLLARCSCYVGILLTILSQ